MEPGALFVVCPEKLSRAHLTYSYSNSGPVGWLFLTKAIFNAESQSWEHPSWNAALQMTKGLVGTNLQRRILFARTFAKDHYPIPNEVWIYLGAAIPENILIKNRIVSHEENFETFLIGETVYVCPTQVRVAVLRPLTEVATQEEEQKGF